MVNNIVSCSTRLTSMLAPPTGLQQCYLVCHQLRIAQQVNINANFSTRQKSMSASSLQKETTLEPSLTVNFSNRQILR